MARPHDNSLVALTMVAAVGVELASRDALHVHGHCGHLARGAAPAACPGCDGVARTCAAQVSMLEVERSVVAAVDQVLFAVLGVAAATATDTAATCPECVEVHGRMLRLRDELTSAVGEALLHGAEGAS